MKAYPDKKNKQLITIGYGSTKKLDGSNFHENDIITKKEAMALVLK